MLLVKTKIKRSPIAGFGLFADQYIPKGTAVWQYEPSIDMLLSTEQISRLSPEAAKQFHNYAFLDKTYGKYMLCGDDARFFNHAIECNCDDGIPNLTIAQRDIMLGEELTVDYSTFYDDIDSHPEILQFISPK